MGSSINAHTNQGDEMRKGTLSRQQAIDQVGAEAVKRVEAENCDFTNRLMPAGWEDEIEFSSSIICTDHNGNDCRLIAYYYQDADTVNEAEGLDHLDWIIHGYEIV